VVSRSALGWELKDSLLQCRYSFDLYGYVYSILVKENLVFSLLVAIRGAG